MQRRSGARKYRGTEAARECGYFHPIYLVLFMQLKLRSLLLAPAVWHWGIRLWIVSSSTKRIYHQRYPGRIAKVYSLTYQALSPMRPKRAIFYSGIVKENKICKNMKYKKFRRDTTASLASRGQWELWVVMWPCCLGFHLISHPPCSASIASFNQLKE